MPRTKNPKNVWVDDPPDNTNRIIDILPHDFDPLKSFCVCCGGAIDFDWRCVRCNADHFDAAQRKKKMTQSPKPDFEKLKELFAKMPLPIIEPFPDENLRAQGWVYRDLPRISPEFFEILIKTIGEENIRWLSMADYGNAKRGQCFISPKGIENLKAYSIKQTEEAATRN